jgi:hypothetical protein
MKPSNLALQPGRAEELPVEDQPAPGNSAPQENPIVVPVGHAAPPRTLRRRRHARGIVIRDQGLSPFRVY